jgi:MFS family permease
VAIQVYALTQSSFYVGLVGVFALVPLVALGLYGGAIADAVDRRTLALVASAGLWAVSIALMVQAFLDVGSIWFLYGCISVQSGFYAVNNPARSAMVPRLLDKELMPAAAALNMASFNLGTTFGPMVGALVIHWHGFAAAYTIDVVTFSAAYYALIRMPKMPPMENSPRAGLKSVVDGLRFLKRSPNLRMTFILDLIAMILAQPRALLPAIGALMIGGGETTVGILLASVAVGAFLAGLFSGPLGAVRRQGSAVVWSVMGWGASFAAFGLVVVLAGRSGSGGLTFWLVPAAICCALAGIADSVSAVFRTTILQAATPDHLRGRLQGVFIVVVAGGPRLGDMLAGGGTKILSEGWVLLLGGIMCIVVAWMVARWQSGFLKYDARNPVP